MLEYSSINYIGELLNHFVFNGNITSNNVFGGEKMIESSELRWLHISDLHIGSPANE